MYKRQALPTPRYALRILEIFALTIQIKCCEYAGSSESRNRSSSHFCTLDFESWKTKYVRVVRQDNANRLVPGLLYMYFEVYFFLLQMLFTVLSGFFRRRLYCYKAQPCKMSLSNCLKPGAKMIPAQSKLFPTVLKEPNTLFWYVGRRFLQQPSTSMARRTEQVPWSSSPLYFVDEIMSTCLVSKYSAY